MSESVSRTQRLEQLLSEKRQTSQKVDLQAQQKRRLALAFQKTIQTQADETRSIPWKLYEQLASDIETARELLKRPASARQPEIMDSLNSSFKLSSSVAKHLGYEYSIGWLEPLMDELFEGDDFMEYHEDPFCEHLLAPAETAMESLRSQLRTSVGERPKSVSEALQLERQMVLRRLKKLHQVIEQKGHVSLEQIVDNKSDRQQRVDLRVLHMIGLYTGYKRRRKEVAGEADGLVQKYNLTAADVTEL